MEQEIMGVEIVIRVEIVLANQILLITNAQSVLLVIIFQVLLVFVSFSFSYFFSFLLLHFDLISKKIKTKQWIACACNVNGSSGVTCQSNGACDCTSGFAGLQCSICASGYFGQNCQGIFSISIFHLQTQ